MKKKKLKILITGAAGFIGNHLFDLLDTKDNIIYSVDIAIKEAPLDIFSSDFHELLRWSDVVYHLAALTSVNQSFKDPDKVFITNVLGTARVAELCAKYKKKLIYPSSAAIYHKDLSPYAYTKFLAEEIVKGIMNTTDVVILRLFNVFGERMNPNSGSVMYNFLTEKKIVVYGDGEQTRDYIHVDDVVAIMKDAIKSKWNGKIVDIGTGKHYTANYVAGLFAHYRDKKIEYKAPRREIKWSIADTQMLKHLYKNPLKTNLKKDIEELCKN